MTRATKATRMQTHAFLFALMTAELLAAWWCFSPLSSIERDPSQLMASSQIPPALPRRALWGECRAANEFPPSNFSPSCRLGSVHVRHLCKRLSCWTRGGGGGEAMWADEGSCYSDARRAFKPLSLRGSSGDDWLWSEDDGLAQPFTFQGLNSHPVSDFPPLSLFGSLQFLHVCARETSFTSPCAYDNDWWRPRLFSSSPITTFCTFL